MSFGIVRLTRGCRGIIRNLAKMLADHQLKSLGLFMGFGCIRNLVWGGRFVDLMTMNDGCEDYDGVEPFAELSHGEIANVLEANNTPGLGIG